VGLAEPHPHAVTPLGVFTVAAETLAVLAGSGGEAAAAVAPWTSGKLDHRARVEASEAGGSRAGAGIAAVGECPVEPDLGQHS